MLSHFLYNKFMIDVISLLGICLFTFLFLHTKNFLFLRLLNLWVLGILWVVIQYYLPTSFTKTILPLDIPFYAYSDVLFLLLEFVFVSISSFIYLFRFKKLKIFSFSGIIIGLLIFLNLSAILAPLVWLFSEYFPNSIIIGILLSIVVYIFTPFFGVGEISTPLLILTNIIVINILISKLPQQKAKQTKKKQ